MHKNTAWSPSARSQSGLRRLGDSQIVRALRRPEEVQMWRVAGYLFGFIKPDTVKGVAG
jgi:hypothetical protein